MSATLKGNILGFAQRSRVVRQVMRQIPLALAGRIVSFARGRWPVKTGRSRAVLRVEEPKPGTVVIIDDAKNEQGRLYVELIVSKGVRPWEEYIVAPAEALVRDLPRIVGKALEDALRVR